jgi:hypothetical protein
VQEARLVERIVRHQEHVPARGDFRKIEQAVEGVELERRHAAAGVPEREMGPGLLKAMATASSPSQRTRG